jgi:hypothetical protein
VWPDRGNSFWVTLAGETWYLFTWTSRGYLVPKSTDIEAVCRACIDGNSAMYVVPDDVQQRFGLRELNEQEVDLVFSRMAKSG